MSTKEVGGIKLTNCALEEAPSGALILRGTLFGNHAAPLKERKNDTYETPPEATHALLRCEPLPHRILEPCCGPGAIAQVLRGAGHHVIAQDLVDYGCPDSSHGIDFLMEFRLPEAEAIVTNPPFKLAAEFIRKGLDMCPLVIVLQRLMFLEGQGRSDIVDGHLSRVHVFRNRLPTMHRHGWEGTKTGSMVPYAWFIFEREKKGPTLMDRISWEPLPTTATTVATSSVQMSMPIIE